ncbi:hypothetical protein PCCS19_05010 [Paenibacillus sp. CCS19]|nr:hypothetical protein PCCS19_05010 [Paenibacillus cellulosilyticus]
MHGFELQQICPKRPRTKHKSVARQGGELSDLSEQLNENGAFDLLLDGANIDTAGFEVQFIGMR